MTGLVSALYGYVNYESSNSDAHLKIFMRSHAVSWACSRLDIANCVDKANRDYHAWMADATKEYTTNLEIWKKTHLF